MLRTVEPERLTHSDAAFELNRAELFLERAGSGSSLLRLKAQGQRHNGDGSYVVDRVAAVLLRRDASLVRVQRYHESNRPFVVHGGVAWSHDVYDAELAATAAVFYLVETRLQVVRTLLTCDLGPVDLIADSAVWPIVAKRAEASDLVQVDVALSTRRGERVDISLQAESDVSHRGHNLTAEFYFLDGDGNVLTSAAASASIVNGVAFERADTGIERATAREIRSVEVRARIDVAVLSEIGPIALPESCRLAQ